MARYLLGREPVDRGDLLGASDTGLTVLVLTERNDVEASRAHLRLEGPAVDVLDGDNFDPDLLAELPSDRSLDRRLDAGRRLDLPTGEPEKSGRMLLVGRPLDQEVLAVPYHRALDVHEVRVLVHAVAGRHYGEYLREACDQKNREESSYSTCSVS